MSDSTRNALVTGAARRIGRAIAFALAEDGWSVAVHHNSSSDDASDVVAGIEARGGRACALHADLGDVAGTEGLVPAAASALGPIALLVNLPLIPL